MFSEHESLTGSDSRLSIPDKYIPDDIPYGVECAYNPSNDYLKLTFNYGETHESKNRVKFETVDILLGSISGRPYEIIFDAFIKNIDRLGNMYKKIKTEVADNCGQSRRKTNNIELMSKLINITITEIRPSVIRQKNQWRK